MKPSCRIAVVIAFGVAVAWLLLMPKSERLSQFDRLCFGMVSGQAENTAGAGTQDDPYRIEVRSKLIELLLPEILYLSDDDGEYFESMPPPPQDVMVLLSRLQERGVKACAIGYPLQWERHGGLALEGMRGVMDRMEGLVLGFAVKDSTSGGPVAPPFQRASVAYAEVLGDGSKLPVVNGIVGDNPELGGDRTLAGFTKIETEKAEENRAYLLARWSDRVVFALPLALEIARRGVAFEEVEIELGKEIRVGETGPRIPIDFRGRVDLHEIDEARSKVKMSAVIERSLADGFAREGAPLYLTDERVLGPKEPMQWANRMPRVDQAVRSAPVVDEVRVCPRPPVWVEWLVIAGLVGLLGRVMRGRSEVAVTVIALIGVLLVAIWLGIELRLDGFMGVSFAPSVFLSVPLLVALGFFVAKRLPQVEVIDGGEAAAVPVSKKAKKGKRRKKKRK